MSGEDAGRAAVRTLCAAGTEVAALVTDGPYGRSRLAGRLRVPVIDDVTVNELFGRGRLSGVRLRHRDGRTTAVRCDTVFFTGDRAPDHELAGHGGLAMDPVTRGPSVDTAYRTSEPGVFAVGALLHAAGTATAAARQGRLAAVCVPDHPDHLDHLDRLDDLAAVGP